MSLVAGAGRVHDAVVVGAGLAGLTAACRLAEAGAEVVVIARGVGHVPLAPGTIDVLGYAPDRVERPGDALAGLAPPHPYATLGAGAVAASLEWFRGCFDGTRLPGYGYTGGLEENALLPTAVGVAKPSALIPETMAAGDLRAPGSAAIVSFRALRDFHPSYLADNLGSTAGIEARGITLDLRPEDRGEVNSQSLARAFDDPDFRAQVADALRGRLEGVDRVGFPAGLGGRDPHGAWTDMQERLGRPVFEISTLPPSAPGMRTHDVLRHRLRRHGGRIVIGSPVTGFEAADGRVTEIRAQASGRERSYRARHYVLATGGWSSGGHALDSRWQARETVLGLPLRGVPAAGEPRFVPDAFASQPLPRSGVATDDRLRALDADGAVVYENVLVAGAALGGAEPWKEKSGTGLSLATGHRAAELILQEGTI